MSLTMVIELQRVKCHRSLRGFWPPTLKCLMSRNNEFVSWKIMSSRKSKSKDTGEGGRSGMQGSQGMCPEAGTREARPSRSNPEQPGLPGMFMLQSKAGCFWLQEPKAVGRASWAPPVRKTKGLFLHTPYGLGKDPDLQNFLALIEALVVSDTTNSASPAHSSGSLPELDNLK